MGGRFLLGLDTYSYHLASPVWGSRPEQLLTLDGYLDRTSRMGLDGLALADMRHFESTEPPAIAHLQAHARRHGLYVELGTGGADSEHLRLVMDLARRFESNVVRTFLSIGSTWGGARDFPKRRMRAIESLQRVMPLAEQTGVSLAIENHQDLRAEELASILAEVNHPLLGVCWDTGNSLGVLEDPLAGLDVLADHVLTVHLKSYAVLPAEVVGQQAGYVLVGAPMEHNDRMLRRTLARLGQRSPVAPLHINVESALEWIPVTPARPGWQPSYAKAAARLLEAYAGTQATQDAWCQQCMSMARAKDVPLQELLAREDQLVRTSVRWAREAVDMGGGEGTGVSPPAESP